MNKYTRSRDHNFTQSISVCPRVSRVAHNFRLSVRSPHISPQCVCVQFSQNPYFLLCSIRPKLKFLCSFFRVFKRRRIRPMFRKNPKIFLMFNLKIFLMFNVQNVQFFARVQFNCPENPWGAFPPKSMGGGGVTA